MILADADFSESFRFHVFVFEFWMNWKYAVAMNFFLYLPTLLLWGYVDMDMGVGCTVSLLGKKIEVDQDKED